MYFYGLGWKIKRWYHGQENQGSTDLALAVFWFFFSFFLVDFLFFSAKRDTNAAFEGRIEGNV